MKVHLVRKETVESYAVANPSIRSPLTERLSRLKHADWEKPADIKATFGSADLLRKSSHRVVFDIGGNSYRMIANMHLEKDGFIYL